jgi:hypothetical protein
MNKKKIISTGVFILMMAIAAGIAYYFYPSAINDALGINVAGINTDSGSDLLAADNASSSLAAFDPNVGSDDPTMSAGVTVVSPAYVASPSSARDNVANIKSSVESTSSPTVTTPSAMPTSCVFPAGVPMSASTTNAIIFNEIAWMGSPLSSTAEWMEIKNISPTVIGLSGWELLDLSGKIKLSFTKSDGILAPGELLLISRGTTAPAAAPPAAKIYSGDLANTGDTLALMDPQCNVSDYLDASDGWPAGNNTTKQTLERDADGIGWHTSAQPGGTPAAENSSGLAPAAPTTTVSTTPVSTQFPQNIVPIENIPEDIFAPSDVGVVTSSSAMTSSTQSTATISAGSASNSTMNATDSADNNALITTTAASSSDHVLIASIQIAGASSSNDLVTLYNPTAAAIDMSGWKLHKKSSTGTDYSLKVFPAGSMIGAGQTFVWANAEGGFSETVSANVSSTETLAADNSVALMDAAGTIVDAVAWGTGTKQYSEGPPYPTSPGANQLLSRRSSDDVIADTDNNSNDFTIQ